MSGTPARKNPKPPPSASEESSVDFDEGTEAEEMEEADEPAGAEEAAAEEEGAVCEDDEAPEEYWEEVEESEALEEWSEDEADEEVAAVVAEEELESGEVEEGGEPPQAEEEPGVPLGENGPEEPALPTRAEMVARGQLSPPKKDELAPGTVLDLGSGGKVTVERRLGRGGMAEVYAGLLETAEECRQRVAVKRVRHGMREALAGRLVDEARVQACVAHANVARLHGFYDVGDSRFILMEYVAGRSLRELLKLARSRGRTLSQAAACWLLAELADALHAVHNATDVAGHPLHVVHRDVTPDNIIVDATGRPRLVDFGVAFSTLPDRVQTGTSNSTWLGKIPYLAPEQVRGDRVDARTDLFALGCILVEALTGEPPFGDEDISTTYRINQVTPAWVDHVTKDVAPPVKAICHKLLAHDPDQRYAHGHEVAKALRACLEDPFSEAQLKAEIAWLEGLLDTTYMYSDLVLVPPEEEDPQQQPPSPPLPEPAPAAPSPPPRFRLPRVPASVVLVACACTAALGWFAASTRQPGTAVAGMAATTPATQPAMPPASAPPQVRLLRRPAPVPGKQGVEALPREAVLTAIGLYARAVLGPPETSRCLPVRGMQPVKPFKNGAEFLACSIEEMLFVRVRTDCQVATARMLVGSSERVEAVWVESGCRNGKCLPLLALRAPRPAVVAGLVLELHQRDGAPCGRVPLEPDQPSANEAQRP